MQLCLRSLQFNDIDMAFELNVPTFYSALLLNVFIYDVLQVRALHVCRRSEHHKRDHVEHRAAVRGGSRRTPAGAVAVAARASVGVADARRDALRDDACAGAALGLLRADGCARDQVRAHTLPKRDARPRPLHRALQVRMLINEKIQ